MSHYPALWVASRRPITDLLVVDARHEPWRSLIEARLLVWRPHRRSPWLGEPPKHPRRVRPVTGEVDLTPGGWGVLGDADTGAAAALVETQRAELADAPHRREIWRAIRWQIASVGLADARHLDSEARRLGALRCTAAECCPAVRPAIDGRPGGIPADDVGRHFRRPHAHQIAGAA
jgi:hypothetical protein